MEGKINQYGWLEIKRVRRFDVQYCPFTDSNPDGETRRCGDWCPHFSEPEKVYSGKIVIGICHSKSLTFREFEDVRHAHDKSRV